MPKKKPKQGGYRAGAGRKTNKEKGMPAAYVPKTIMITEAQRNRLKRYKNSSELIRKLLDRHFKEIDDQEK